MSEPVLDAFRVEVVLHIARERSHVTVIVEFAKANCAFIVLKGLIIVIEFSFHYVANDSILDLFVSLSIFRCPKNSTADAWEATN